MKGLSLSFHSDITAKLFCLIVSIAWLFVTIYATVYMKHEKSEERFFLFSFLTQGAMMGAILSSNLVSMYLFFELVTLFSAPLVLHSLSKEAIAAAKKYLYYSVAGAFLAPFLFGLYWKKTSKLAVWSSFIFGAGIMVLNMLFRYGIKRTRSLIKNNNPRISNKGTGNRYTLTLTTR